MLQVHNHYTQLNQKHDIQHHFGMQCSAVHKHKYPNTIIPLYIRSFIISDAPMKLREYTKFTK